MHNLALDIGNVLCYVDLEEFNSELSSEANITVQEANQFVEKTRKTHDLGLTTIAEDLANKFNFKSETTIRHFVKLWNDALSPNWQVTDFFNGLIDKHSIEIALVSNIGEEHAAIIRQMLNHNGFYDNCIPHLSYEVGARKPTLLYYQSFLMANPQFNNCIYVDDIIENLEMGKKVGLQPYHFVLDTMDLQKELPAIEKLVMAPKTNSRWH